MPPSPPDDSRPLSTALRRTTWGACSPPCSADPSRGPATPCDSVQPAHGEVTPVRRAGRRAAAAVTLILASAASAGAQGTRPCASTAAELTTHEGVWPTPLDALVSL